MKTIIYLHGFNSSPHSNKAKLMREYYRVHSGSKGGTDTATANGAFHIEIPCLTIAPQDVVAQISELIEAIGISNIAGFVGSSLGAFYSLYFQQRYPLSPTSFLKAVLINPAVRPFELLQGYLGLNHNPYTGVSYVVKRSHMSDLEALSVPSVANAENTLLLTQTGDEVLDFQQAVSYLNGAKLWVQYGGNHGFVSFKSVLPLIYSFLEAE